MLNARERTLRDQELAHMLTVVAPAAKIPYRLPFWTSHSKKNYSTTSRLSRSVYRQVKKAHLALTLTPTIRDSSVPPAGTLLEILDGWGSDTGNKGRASSVETPSSAMQSCLDVSLMPSSCSFQTKSDGASPVTSLSPLNPVQLNDFLSTF